jgi:hypothetical protein
MLTKLFGQYGLPADAFAWVIFAFALVLAQKHVSLALFSLGRGRFVALSAGTGGVLSALYTAIYLHGQSRIIDATTYLLQARAFAHAGLGLPVPLVEASGAGRFVLTGLHGVVGIFPPGYPLYLAPFVAAGVPWLAGVVLAGASTAMIYAVAQRAGCDERATRTATWMSVASGALRYHTADTMSHGLVGLLLLAAFWLALGPLRKRTACLLGVLAATVALTRFASVLPISVAFYLLVRRAAETTSVARAAMRSCALAALGALPLLALGALYFRLASGTWQSTQHVYYALSDYPARCFRYGFGHDIGCRFEHADFVTTQLSGGYRGIQALKTTLRRLAFFPGDLANIGPLAVLPLLWLRTLSPTLRMLGVAVLLQVLAYVPFYFDGNYPGGGARMYADALPLALIVLGTLLTEVMRSGFAAKLGSLRYATWPVCASMIGFATHAAYDHRQLRDRDGGSAFYPAAARTLRGPHLLLVDNDAAFNLSLAARADASVARMRGDDHDRLLWERLGQPNVFALRSGQIDRVTDYRPSEEYSFFGGSYWPARSLTAAAALPAFTNGACGVRGPGLRLYSNNGGNVHLRQALPQRAVIRFRVDVAVPVPSMQIPRVELRVLTTTSELRLSSSAASAPHNFTCVTLEGMSPSSADGELVLSDFVTGTLLLSATADGSHHD